MDNKVETVLNGALDGLKKLVDVDTVIGDPIKATDDITLIPISKVSCGFVSGGSGFGAQKDHFGGGAGGSVKVTPVCFLVIRGDNIRMLPVSESESGAEKLIDMVPEVIDKISGLIKKKEDSVEEEV